jgi:hypothetical protein
LTEYTPKTLTNIGTGKSRLAMRQAFVEVRNTFPKDSDNYKTLDAFISYILNTEGYIYDP